MPTSISWEVGSRALLAREDAEAPSLGRDLLFTDDLQVDASGDYQTIEGPDNLRAAIRRRLLVSPGEYKMRPDYGVGVRLFLKRPATTALLDDLKRRVRDQLARERRIEKVLSVEVEPRSVGGVRVYVIQIAITSGGREHRFEPFEISDEVT